MLSLASGLGSPRSSMVDDNFAVVRSLTIDIFSPLLIALLSKYSEKFRNLITRSSDFRISYLYIVPVPAKDCLYSIGLFNRKFYNLRLRSCFDNLPLQLTIDINSSKGTEDIFYR